MNVMPSYIEQILHLVQQLSEILGIEVEHLREKNVLSILIYLK